MPRDKALIHRINVKVFRSVRANTLSKIFHVAAKRFDRLKENPVS